MIDTTSSNRWFLRGLSLKTNSLYWKMVSSKSHHGFSMCGVSLATLIRLPHFVKSMLNQIQIDFIHRLESIPDATSF